MDAAHTLLEAVRIPWNIIVDHQGAELQVDALATRLRRDHDLVLVTKVMLCLDAAIQAHAAVDIRHSKAPLTQPLRQIVESIARLGEDKQLFAAGSKLTVLNHLAQFRKFGLHAMAFSLTGQLDKVLQLLDLELQFLPRLSGRQPLEQLLFCL